MGPPRVAITSRRHSGGLLVVVGFVLLAFAVPARAHPFGPPPVAELVARGDTVYVAWSADVDDVVTVAVEAGVLPSRAVEDFADGVPSTQPEGYDVDALGRDQAFHEHLVGAISVVQDGQPCEGQVTAADDVLYEGVRFAYRCPHPVKIVDVGIDLLHGLHPAYRTYTTARGRAAPSQTILSASQPVQRYTFGDGAPAGSGPSNAAARVRTAAAVGTAAATGVALVLGSVLVRRRAG